jgi:hypothetical protein
MRSIRFLSVVIGFTSAQFGWREIMGPALYIGIIPTARCKLDTAVKHGYFRP